MTTDTRWTAEDIPDQSGRIALVTGANSGLGFETSKSLARKGAHVVLACRNMAKGNAAADQLHQETPGISIEVMQLDLADLDSIRQFAGAFSLAHGQLHILVNSAGVMATPRRLTADGFELQFGTNHLGHFALTGLLLERLLEAPKSRVVTVSSVGELLGTINFDDLMAERSYWRWMAYGRSKLANLLFAYELHRRLEAARKQAISLAAHPGYAATGLRTELMGSESPFFHRLVGLFFERIAQPAWLGALPQLYAATAPGVRGGEYYGPGGLFQSGGYPRRVRSSRRSYDKAIARRLWRLSEELTGVEFAL